MLPDRVLNPGSLTYESGALPIALRGLAELFHHKLMIYHYDDFDFDKENFPFLDGDVHRSTSYKLFFFQTTVDFRYLEVEGTL